MTTGAYACHAARDESGENGFTTVVVAHPIALTAMAGTSVLLRELIPHLSGVGSRVRATYLDLAATTDCASALDAVSGGVDGGLRFLGVNTHLEPCWERSIACYERCQRAKIPAFVWIHDYWPHHGDNVRLLAEKLDVTLLASTSTVRDGLGEDGFRASVVQVGLPIGNIEARRPGAGAGGSRFVVGTAGRLVPRKRHLDVLRAFERARIGDLAELRLRLFPSLVYSPAEDASMLADLMGRAHAIGSSRGAVVIEHEPRPRHNYGAYSIYICASDYEGFSMTPIEAIYSGCPALLSDIPAHREIANILHPEDGHDVLFTPGDVDRLAELIRDEARSGRRRARLEARSLELRALIEARWSLRETARDLIRALCRASNGSRPADGRAS